MKWKTDVASILRNNSFFILLLLLLVAHIPFLTADPDINISFSRGPFTDEGLNTIQARNWVNHGYLDLEECDNFLKTPLLGSSLALTYLIFGTSHIISRLHILILVLVALFVISCDRKHRGYLAILTLITLLQYHVFQFSHFSLAEMLACSSILLSIHYLARSADLQFGANSRRNQAILAGLFLSLAYYFKIQFIYLILLIPLTQILTIAFANPLNRRLVFRQGYFTSATLLIFVLLFFMAWYLPNRTTFDFIMSHQSGEFSLSGKIWEYLQFNLTGFLWNGWMIAFVIIFLMSLPVGFYLLSNHSASRYPILFLASFSWFLLELHKLLMVYLPTRYRISLYVSMGLMISIVLSEIWQISSRRTTRNILSKAIKASAFLMVSILLTINLYIYYQTYQRREYKIRDLNHYLQKTVKQDETVIGAWAPSLTWDCKARSLPVWNNFLNYMDPVNQFHPRAIISEIDEQDSEQAYKSQGIDLLNISDSMITEKVGLWKVGIYWISSPSKSSSK